MEVAGESRKRKRYSSITLEKKLEIIEYASKHKNYAAAKKNK